MQGWMIALIVIACVIAVLAALIAVGANVALKSVLGRRKKRAADSELLDKYGIDVSWFSTTEIAGATEYAEIDAYDGIKLSAMFLKHRAVDGDARIKRVALLQHGYLSSPQEMQPYAKIFWDKGYDVVLPSARAHGKSGGKYIGMAWLDRFDVMRWTDKVVELYGEDVSVVLMGVSMGGATVAAVSGMTPPPQVKCIIDDCGFSSQKEEYYACLKKVPLPKPIAMLPLAIGVRLKCGYSVYDADIKPLVASSAIPTLFIHGKKDTFVPCELGKKLYDACGAAAKKFELFDAVHAANYASDPDRYAALVSDFADCHIG